MSRSFRAITVFFLSGLLIALRLYSQEPAVDVERDIVYGSVSGIDLKFDLYKTRSDKPLPAILLLHTSSGTKSDPDLIVPWSRYLASQGYAAIAVEHRRFPINGGPNFPAQLQDVRCALNYVRSHAGSLNINPERIGMLGFSSGGWLAAMIGTTADSKEFESPCQDALGNMQIEAVVSYYGVSDFLQMPRIGQFDVGNVLLGKPCLPGSSQATELCTQASPVNHVSTDDAPFLLVHGTADNNVPFSQSESMKSALESAKVEVELVRVERAGHIWKITTPFEAQVQERLIPFLEKHLKQ